MIVLDFFRKYALNIFFVVLLLVVVRSPITPIFITKNLTYAFFFVSAFFIFWQALVNPRVFLQRSFLLFYIVWFVYLIYFILFDQSYEGLAYLILKGVTFATIIICSSYYFKHYIKTFPETIVKSGLFILFLGLFFDQNILQFRYDGILNNPNTLGFLSSIILGILILKEDFSTKKIFLMLFLIVMILASGSRGAILGVLIALLFRSFTLKNIIFLGFVLISLLAINEVATHLGMETGLNRIKETKGSFTSRNMTNYYGYKTLMLSPWTGFGLDKYAFITSKVIPIQLKYILVPNPHNSYMGMFIQLGIPFAIIILLTMLYYILKMLLSREKDKIFLFLVVFSAISGLYESHLFSLFAFEGIVFWISIGLYLKYINDHGDI